MLQITPLNKEQYLTSHVWSRLETWGAYIELVRHFTDGPEWNLFLLIASVACVICKFHPPKITDLEPPTYASATQSSNAGLTSINPFTSPQFSPVGGLPTFPL